MLNKKILNTLKNKINNKKFKIETNLGQFTINHTKNHQLKKFLKNFPLYDRFIPHLAEQNKKKIIDIGANIGDTLSLIKSKSNIDIICVEPDEKFYKILEKNVSENNFSGVKLYPYAISSSKKKIEITNIDNDSSGFITESKTGKITKSFEELIIELNIKFKDFGIIKIDTDGFDWDCLNSIHSYFVKNNESIDFIFYEHQTATNNQLDNIEERRIGEKKYFDTLNNFKELGYNKFFVFDNYGTFLIETSEIDLIHSLVLYLRKSFSINKIKTIHFFDILITKDKNVKQVYSAIDSYKNSQIKIL